MEPEEQLFGNDSPKLPWMLHLSNEPEGRESHLDPTAYTQTWCDDLRNETKTSAFKLTQLMCTIGENNRSVAEVKKLMAAGVGAARIDASLYRGVEKLDVVDDIRKAVDAYSKELGRVYPFAVAVDVGAGIIRTGKIFDFEGEVLLKDGATISITSDTSYSEAVNADVVYVDYQIFNDLILVNDVVHIDAGRIQLKVIEKCEKFSKCDVIKGGKLVSYERVTLPNILFTRLKFNETDKKDLVKAIDARVDAILLSKVANAKVITTTKSVLALSGQKHIMVIAKINNNEALLNIDSIIDVADGIMIDRDSALSDITKEDFFIAQKNIISKCIKRGIPSIGVVTLSESTKEPFTSSEIQDVSNSVLDTIDCIYLSKQSQKSPITPKDIQRLNRCCRNCESRTYQRHSSNALRDLPYPIEPVYTVAAAAVEASLPTRAATIILCTTSGRSAKVISKFRPRCPIIAVTRCSHVARQLTFFRGVHPLLHIRPPRKDWQVEMDKRMQLGITFGKVSGFIIPGDVLILVNTTREGTGLTNGFRIVYASEYDCKLPAPIILKG